MAVANQAGPAARTYGNWRRPTSPGLWQLGALGTGLLLFFMIIEILLMATAGLVPAPIRAPISGVAFLVLTVKDRHRRSIAQRVTARVAFRRHRKRGHNLYRSGPLGQLPWGSFQMPGLAAPSRQHIRRVVGLRLPQAMAIPWGTSAASAGLSMASPPV